MRPRTLVLALAAGIAVFLVVAVVVTELALPYIEFSLFVGLPAGALAGLLAAAYVLLRGDAEPPATFGALALGAFGVVFLTVLVVAVVGFAVRNSLAVPVAGGVGSLAALATYLWLARQRPATPTPQTG